MTGTRSPWVGDLVRDEANDRLGVVTDVLAGAIWVLRPECGPGRWTSRTPERLSTVTPRAERSA
ncbi:hypothetical protein ACFY64_36260 [Streptomyces collinus]|uniref:hypothetical protein n=1 Tax=Streptomyces collinus TaxID=42684 RepID=UPI00369FD5CE